jgi:hypothetical protein
MGPALERYIDLMLAQLEADLLGFIDDDPLWTIEEIRSDLDRIVEFGVGSARVVTRLERLRDSPQPLVRRWVEEAIIQIAPRTAGKGIRG